MYNTILYTCRYSSLCEFDNIDISRMSLTEFHVYILGNNNISCVIINNHIGVYEQYNNCDTTDKYIKNSFIQPVLLCGSYFEEKKA